MFVFVSAVARAVMVPAVGALRLAAIGSACRRSYRSLILLRIERSCACERENSGSDSECEDEFLHFDFSLLWFVCLSGSSVFEDVHQLKQSDC